MMRFAIILAVLTLCYGYLNNPIAFSRFPSQLFAVRAGAAAKAGGVKPKTSAVTPKPATSSPDRKYASYVVYKGKAALSMKLISPTWTMLGEGNGKTVSREGGLLCEFAPSVGQRQYDWSKKSSFFMSASECGELLANFEKGAEFLHDPNMGTAQAGTVTKKIKWAPGQDKKGLFVSLYVTDKSSTPSPISISLPMSWGEYTVVDSVLRYAIPHMIGFDKIWSENTVTADADTTQPSTVDSETVFVEGVPPEETD